MPAGDIEDVWFGCANQAGEDNRNVARFAALLAGLPDSVGGVTVNRLCASGLSAVVGACHAVVAGDGDLFVAGGVESMTRAPLVTAKPTKPFERGDRTMHDTTLGWRFVNPAYAAKFSTEAMGETGENVAERWGVSREDQDAFALVAPARWAAADAAGRFADELVPVAASSATSIRGPDTTAREAGVAEAGVPRRRHGHRGQLQRINDGAAALVIASEERARDLGIEPLGVFAGSASAGVDPGVMGVGRCPPSRSCSRGRARVERIDLVELNEAFASQSLAVVRELGIDPERVNVNGGAIALGHPLGMSGARLVVTLLTSCAAAGPPASRPCASASARARPRCSSAASPTGRAARRAPARRRRTSRMLRGSRGSRGWPPWPGRRPSGSS